MLSFVLETLPFSSFRTLRTFHVNLVYLRGQCLGDVGLHSVPQHSPRSMRRLSQELSQLALKWPSTDLFLLRSVECSLPSLCRKLSITSRALIFPLLSALNFSLSVFSSL